MPSCPSDLLGLPWTLFLPLASQCVSLSGDAQSTVPGGGSSLTLDVAQVVLLISKSFLMKVRPLSRLISMRTALEHRKGRR